jgi:hypothetical protein
MVYSGMHIIVLQFAARMYLAMKPGGSAKIDLAEVSSEQGFILWQFLGLAVFREAML